MHRNMLQYSDGRKTVHGRKDGGGEGGGRKTRGVRKGRGHDCHRAGPMQQEIE